MIEQHNTSFQLSCRSQNFDQNFFCFGPCYVFLFWHYSFLALYFDKKCTPVQGIVRVIVLTCILLSLLSVVVYVLTRINFLLFSRRIMLLNRRPRWKNCSRTSMYYLIYLVKSTTKKYTRKI
jgi:hypothetical protein